MSMFDLMIMIYPLSLICLDLVHHHSILLDVQFYEYEGIHNSILNRAYCTKIVALGNILYIPFSVLMWHKGEAQ